MSPPFVGRKPELAALDRLWNSPKAQFLVLYGRRRVGKTRLLTHWINQNDKRVILWLVDPDSRQAHLRQFSQAVWNFTYPGSPAPEDFSYATWDQAWGQVAELARKDRVGVFIDEFTYLLEADETLAGKFQRIWDQMLEKANLCLVISGSHLGMMQRGVLSYQAPLYGRATAQMHLGALPFGLTRQYFPTYSAMDRVALYAIFGGIPQYWRMVDPDKTLTQNIQDLLLAPGGVMEGETRLLLQDYLSDLHNYISILRAIANGHNTPKEIEGFTGIVNVHTSAYLKMLVETGYVARSEPVTARHPTRSGRYYITDPFLRFYYRFLASRKEQFALGEAGQAFQELKRYLIDFIGTYTWEELCREWTLRAASRREMPLYPDQVGSVWEKGFQLDVVGVNSMERHLVLGECKWTAEKTSVQPLRRLVEENAARIIPDERKWQVYFLGFARAGWTEEALAYAVEINRSKPSGENWTTTGIRLVSLDEVDEDLARWAG